MFKESDASLRNTVENFEEQLRWHTHSDRPKIILLILHVPFRNKVEGTDTIAAEASYTERKKGNHDYANETSPWEMDDL